MECKQEICKGFSQKVFLQLDMPTEDSPVSDHKRLLRGLEERGFAPVTFPLHILRRLYPLCRACDFAVTLTLVWRENGWTVTGIEPGDRTGAHYGLAVDYGSTTIVMQLVDMHSGTVIDQVSTVNGQTCYGTDILTRITYALEDPSHMDHLQQVTIASFQSLLQQISDRNGVDAASCGVMIVSGNTTMIHFLLRLDAWTVFASPYAPVTVDPGWFWGEALGMEFDGLLYIIPAASNYIGGDIVSGLLKVDIHNKEETSLFFDIGTNGELVIGNREWMIAGAGAAGPALEGYISRYGMRAAPGAIDTLKIENNTLTFTTIENEKPVGICGSGIIDLVANMFLSGWINMAGDFDPAASDRIRYLPEEGQYAAVYATEEESATGEALVFTQTDIRQYLDTKAAAYTMVDCLLDVAGCQLEDIAHCYLSGAFSAHSNLESAITIGMFPDLDRKKYSAYPNTSLDGARTLLLDRTKLEELQMLMERIFCFQFASIPDFLVRMQAAKFLPHTDLDRYPTIKARMQGG